VRELRKLIVGPGQLLGLLGYPPLRISFVAHVF
jgi:hypothetical protein